MTEVAVGVGMRPGTGAAEVEAAVAAALEVLAEPVVLCCLATVDSRANEPGIVAAAAALGVAIRSYPPAELSVVPGVQHSARTAAALGTPSVAEAAAVLAGDRLVVAKRIVGPVTVAVAACDGTDRAASGPMALA
ncbi:cobalamin biosynthesis protein [Aldersonia kunmingensis]|uniref:cobalamin biosynthesis protein n=1 Tax=Aldersonia kunmingensis TaxID=408066 RepID=UPI000835B27C|nr:cobalamin biosynthesis protein [Aldersonia kunmingensis]